MRSHLMHAASANTTFHITLLDKPFFGKSQTSNLLQPNFLYQHFSVVIIDSDVYSLEICVFLQNYKLSLDTGDDTLILI